MEPSEVYSKLMRSAHLPAQKNMVVEKIFTYVKDENGNTIRTPGVDPTYQLRAVSFDALTGAEITNGLPKIVKKRDEVAADLEDAKTVVKGLEAILKKIDAAPRDSLG